MMSGSGINWAIRITAVSCSRAVTRLWCRPWYVCRLSVWAIHVSCLRSINCRPIVTVYWHQTVCIRNDCCWKQLEIHLETVVVRLSCLLMTTWLSTSRDRLVPIPEHRLVTDGRTDRQTHNDCAKALTVFASVQKSCCKLSQVFCNMKFYILTYSRSVSLTQYQHYSTARCELNISIWPP